MTVRQDNASPRRRSRLEDVGREVDKVINRAADRVDDETEKLIAYLNEEVVPSVRQHSTRGLRKAADKLSRFADYLDSARSR